MLADISAALRRGDAHAAASSARELVAAEPENAQAQHLLGLALHKLGDIENAKAALDRAIALAPEQAMFQFSRASLSLGEHELLLAEQGLQQSLALDPNLLHAYVALVHLSLGQGRGEEAARYLRLAQRVDAEHPHVLVAQGHVAQLDGRAEDAARCFTAAVKADPRFALAQVSLGMAYMARQHWAFAEQALGNAVALDAGNPGVLRVLAEALRKQGKAEEAIAVLDRLLAQRDETPARAVRGELKMGLGQVDGALEDFFVVLDRLPAQPAVLRVMVTELARQGRFEQAIGRVEAALAAEPSDASWLLRLGLVVQSQDEARQVLERWHAASPDNSACLERMALWHEGAGELERAASLATRSLAINPAQIAAQFVLIRAGIRQDPESALARLAELEPAARSPEAARMLHGWRALALDRLGRYEEAGQAWRRLLAAGVRPGYPLPQPQPAVTAGGLVEGQLLWSPPGVRLERVLQVLQPILGPRLLADRTGPEGRDDGFGFEREPPGAALRWQETLRARGMDPAQAVDWLPFVDAHALAALAGARLTAVLVDPRDAILNWMVFGSAQGYAFPADGRLAADWLAQGLEAVLAHRELHPEHVGIVALDDIDTDAGPAAAALQASLGLTEVPAAELLGQPILALGGLPNQFPAGHWRHYREVFVAEFARLTPLAVRLGYPAE